MLRHADRCDTVKKRRSACVFLACAWTLAFPVQAQTQTRSDTREPPAFSADALVRRAFENLESVGISARIDARITAPDGSESQRRFQVLRQRTPEGLRTLVAGFEQGSNLEGVRLLQIDAADPRETRAFIYSSDIGPRPRPTPYRLVEAFLGRAMLEEKSLASLPVRGVDFEILGRTPATVQGEDVERIRVRPLRPADHDGAELFIAPADAVILESRYYVNGEADPFRVLQTPRPDMQRVGTYLLPEKMIYTERGTKTVLDLSYVVLTDASAPLFDPSRFHLPSLESVEPTQLQVP